jgi:porin
LLQIIRAALRDCHPLAAMVLAGCFAASPGAAQPAPAPLLGDLGGARTQLADLGISLGLTDTESLFGNLAGGVKQGATLQGVTLATLQADTGKLFGLAGGTLYASALQIHGRSFSPYYLDNLQNVNTTEAADSTRLWELWYDQRFANGLLDLRIGQQSIDQEFMLSPFAGVFSNMMAGWPILPSEDFFAGGPAYPLSSLAVRLQVAPRPDFSVQTAVFDDNPSGGPFNDDPPDLDAGGTLFNLHSGALFITEAKFSRPAAAHLPGSYKVGRIRSSRAIICITPGSPGCAVS